MTRVKINSKVTVYEKDDGDWGSTDERVELSTHWNDDRGNYVVLHIAGHSYTVVASDLRAAIQAVTTR